MLQYVRKIQEKVYKFLKLQIWGVHVQTNVTRVKQIKCDTGGHVFDMPVFKVTNLKQIN